MPKRLPAPPRSTVEKVKAFAAEEYNNETKYNQNIVRPLCPALCLESAACKLSLHIQMLTPLRLPVSVQALLKAVSMFVGAIVLFRTAGEAFNV